jgi:aldehyde:ferredoxin oxidoreductase
MKSGLYAGTVLSVDLSSGAISREPTDPFAASFLGGRGINAKLLYDRITPGVDALAPGNVLVFGVGPFCGTAVSGARTEVTAKSPETGLLGSTNFGGYFAAELKFAGYDHIVITGRAATPVYIWIDNDEVEIRDAAAAWGSDTYKAPETIRHEVGNPEARLVCIGPAGENLVRFASVQHEMGHGGARTGLGAVMGSKNLKAIAVRGTKGIGLADAATFLALVQRARCQVQNDPVCSSLTKHGVTPALDDQSEAWLAFAETIVPEGMDPRTHVPKTQDVVRKFAHKRAGCFGCPVQCMEHYMTDESKSGVISCELYSVFVHFVRCSDAAASLESAIRCQKYGLDAISTGGLITWLMRLYEKGIITEQDTDGIPMTWGSPRAIIGMIEKIAHRQGIGNVLADGIVAAAGRLGRGSEAFAYQVKGLQMLEHSDPGWTPYVKGACLSAAVGPRGDNIRSLSSWSAISPHSSLKQGIREITHEGVRNESPLDSEPQSYEGKAELVVAAEDLVTVADMLGTCKWLVGVYTAPCLAELFSAGSGAQVTPEDLIGYAKRVRTMERAYEALEGLTSDMDTLPESFFNKPIQRGVWRGGVLEPQRFEEMKRSFYSLRGWDPATGVPTEETLRRMGLNEIAEDLKAHGAPSAGG